MGRAVSSTSPMPSSPVAFTSLTSRRTPCRPNPDRASQYIAGMARFYDCQFIISSHSPFMLATPFAKIYDMDSNPISTTKWTDIPSVRTYHDFFEAHAGEFRNG